MSRAIARPNAASAINVLASVVVVCFIAFALYWARAIFIPLALAIFISFILTPLVVWLQRRGLGRVLSVALVVLMAFAVSGTVFTVVGSQVVQLTKTLPDHEDRIKAKVGTVKEWVSSNENNRLAALIGEIQSIIAGDKPPAGSEGSKLVVDSSPSWVDRAQVFVNPAVEVLGQAAFTCILIIFMLLKREDLRNRMIRLLGEGQVTTTTKAVDEASRRISRYLLVQFLLNSAFGIVISAGLFLMEVPYAPIWGFTAFLMRYVPYIGTWIGVIPPAIFAFALSDGWALPVGVVVLFLGLELICNNFVEPFLYGSHLGLSEVAQLVATAFWALLWGPVGMILAWPLTACLLVMGKYVSQFRFLNVLLGDQPVLSPQVAFYQRLAARDQDEAEKIVETEMSERPAEKVFDELLVPTLIEAGKDASEGKLSEPELAFIAGAIREIAEHYVDFVEAKPAEKPSADRVRILLAPARNEMERVSCELQASLLETGLWEKETVNAETLTAEVLDTIEKFNPAILVLGSLPPGGLTHTRFLCKRIRNRFPDLKIVIGRWAAAETLDEDVLKQMREAGADEVAKSLEEAKTILSGWRAVFAATTVPADEKQSARKRIASDGMIRA